jgi:hypothetical protein
MQGPAIKSKPSYSPLAPDPGGVHHLLVGHGCGGEALIRLYRALGGPRGSTEIHYAPAPVPAGELGAAIAGLDAERTEIYGSVDDLLAVLPGVLEGCAMGTRLYVAGSETFLWRITAIGRAFGMDDDEIRREPCGPAARRVYCVHCKAITDDVRTTVAECAGCGMTLLVRDHFSRRLAAYMGVKVDAEVPGEIPGPEALDP